MPSVLHLVGASADVQTRQVQRAAARHLGSGFATVTRTLGAGGEYRHVPAAIVGLRREPADVVCAWGMAALASTVLAHRRRVLFMPDRFLGKRSLRWVRTLMGGRDVDMLCPTDAQYRVAIGQGIPPARCHVLRPGVDFAQLRRRRDPVLRAALGFTEQDFVLLPAGESGRTAGHDLVVWVCGILHILDPTYRVLLWGRGPAAQQAAALAGRLHQADMLRVAEQRLGRAVAFEELLSAADACLVTPTGVVPTLPIATAMAAGVPLVATVNYTVAELLEDRHTALMVPAAQPKALARRVMDLRADTALQYKLADTARAEAYEFFSQSRMLQRYRRVIRQVAEGRAVDVDAEDPRLAVAS